MSTKRKPVGRYLYGAGGLFSVTEAVVLLMTPYLARTAEINELALMLAMLFGLALPALTMPLLYALINGSTRITTGRYHIPLALSALAASLACVTMLGVGGKNAPLQAFLLIGLLFVFSLCAQIYNYCYFSIGVRLDPSGRALKVKSACSAASILIAAVAVLFLHDGTLSGVRATFAAAGIVGVIAGAVVYASTVMSMPAFIRIEPRHKRPLREHYARFVAPLKSGTIVVFVAATFSLCVALALGAAAIPMYVFEYALDFSKGMQIHTLIVTALIAVCGVVISFVVKKYGERVGVRISFISVIVQTVAAIVCAALICAPVAQSAQTAVLTIFAASMGLAIGSALCSESRAKEYAAQKVACTPGRYCCLRNCVAALGFGVGAAMAAVVGISSTHLGGNTAAALGCALYAAFLLASVLLLCVGYYERSRRIESRGVAAKEKV